MYFIPWSSISFLRDLSISRDLDMIAFSTVILNNESFWSTSFSAILETRRSFGSWYSNFPSSFVDEFPENHLILKLWKPFRDASLFKIWLRTNSKCHFTTGHHNKNLSYASRIGNGHYMYLYKITEDVRCGQSSDSILEHIKNICVWC